jgi:hypothetical protein
MTFKTRNLYAAAALHASGRPLHSVTIEDDGKRAFWFEDRDRGCADLELRYFLGTLPPMQPRDVLDALLTVRRAMYATTA